MHPKFKAGDLVRCKWVEKGDSGLGVVCSDDTNESNLGCYYRIYYFADREKIWGHPRDWILVE